MKQIKCGIGLLLFMIVLMIGGTVFADIIVLEQAELVNFQGPESYMKYNKGDILEFSFSVKGTNKQVTGIYMTGYCYNLRNGSMFFDDCAYIGVLYNTQKKKWEPTVASKWTPEGYINWGSSMVTYNSMENRYTVRTVISDISICDSVDFHSLRVSFEDNTGVDDTFAHNFQCVFNNNCYRNIHTVTSQTTFEVLQKSTCVETGKRAKRCLICQDIIDSTIETTPMLGHTPRSYSETIQSLTCTSDKKVGIRCEKCSQYIPETVQVTQKAQGHQWEFYKSSWRENKKEIQVWMVCKNKEHKAFTYKPGYKERWYKLNYKSLTLGINQSTDIVKVTSTESGDVIKSWTPKDDSIATVDKNGKITGKKVGSTTVYANFSDGFMVPIQVYVKKDKVTTSSISVSTAPVKLKIGETHSLNATPSPITSSQGLTYKTSNKKVATVSSKGVITAKKAGTATITITSGKKSKKIKVTVSKPAPTGIKNVPASKSLQKGKSFTIKPKVTPTGAEAKFTYSSSDSKVATVSKSGKVTAKKAGTATITVKAGSIKVQCKVTVTAPAPKSIKNIPAKKTLKVGKTLTLKPKLSPTGAEAKISYTSSDETVVVVSSSGKITAKKKGTATITVKAGKISKKCKITVK